MYSFRVKRLVQIIFIFVILLGIVVFGFLYEKTPEVVPIVVSEDLGPKREVIGRSVEGRAIEMYSYGSGAKHLAFVGGIHGGYEWNSVLLAYTFIDYLAAHPEIIPKNLTIKVVPSANPDGLYAVVGKEGRFTAADASVDKKVLASGRFNAHEVDINRNFDCKWKPESTWQAKIVSAGSEPFSEPEAQAIRDFVLEYTPEAVIFWHSQSNAVYASKCEGDILPETVNIMNAYSKGSGYPAVKTFDAYEITGAADDWLSSMNIPAITVELKTHETVEWEKNLAGIKELLTYYGQDI